MMFLNNNKLELFKYFKYHSVTGCPGMLQLGLFSHFEECCSTVREKAVYLTMLSAVTPTL